MAIYRVENIVLENVNRQWENAGEAWGRFVDAQDTDRIDTGGVVHSGSSSPRTNLDIWVWRVKHRQRQRDIMLRVVQLRRNTD